MKIAMTAILLGGALAASAMDPAPATAQHNAARAHAPASAQRAAILAALRRPIGARLGGNIEFAVDELRVQNGWALVAARPRRRGGGRIDPARYFSSRDLDQMDGINVTAVLRYRAGRWSVVEHRIGATDVWYLGYCRRARIFC